MSNIRTRRTGKEALHTRVVPGKPKDSSLCPHGCRDSSKCFACLKEDDDRCDCGQMPITEQMDYDHMCDLTEDDVADTSSRSDHLTSQSLAPEPGGPCVASTHAPQAPGPAAPDSSVLDTSSSLGLGTQEQELSTTDTKSPFTNHSVKMAPGETFIVNGGQRRVFKGGRLVRVEQV